MLEPFGAFNENPFFLIEKVKTIRPKIIKDSYISFYVKSKTGKLLVLDTGHKTCSVSAEIITTITENLFNKLKKARKVNNSRCARANKLCFNEKLS